MAADVGLVPHASQRDTHIFTSHCLGNAGGNGGLTDAGRSSQTEDLSARFRSEFAHGQILKHLLLDLTHPAVLAVEQFTGRGNIQSIFGIDIPGQLQANIQIIAQDRPLLGAWRHMGQVIAVLQEFLLRLRWQGKRFNFSGIFISFGAGILPLAQFTGDCAEFLAQVVVLLVLIHLLMNFFFDMILDPQQFRLPREQAADLGKAFCDIPNL